MENILFLLATSFVLRLSSSRAFRSMRIGNTGCSALLLNNRPFERSITADGDEVYVHESRERNVRYGIICIRLQDPGSLDETTEMLHSYIDKLRGPFFILHRFGLKKAMDWNTEGTHCLVDYWQDAEHADWKVKGYTNGRCMAVLYVKNIGQVDVEKHDLFLDSFHFSAA